MYKLFFTYLKRCHHLSQFTHIRIRDYLVKVNARDQFGRLTNIYASRVELANKLSAGLVAFVSGALIKDGTTGMTMYEINRFGRKLTQEMREGVDDASLYAKELGEALDLPVSDDRERPLYAVNSRPDPA
jgi:hypothetical protein